MVKVKWNEEALLDIDEIAEYIAVDSVTYAMIQVDNFFNRVEGLTNVPYLGVAVPEFNDENLRQLLEGSYRIIYEIKSKGLIEILCVIHGMRLLEGHPTFKKKK